MNVSIDQVADELEAIAVRAPNALGYFPALYVRVTREVAAGIREQRFEDGERMERFAVAFANYFIRAHAARVRIPRCWRATWDVADDQSLLITQHLLLGINAHVNHDLAQAVVDVAAQYGDLQAVRADFDSINVILTNTLADVIRDLDRVSRWSNEAAALGGGRLFNFSLQVARSRAWSASERLYPLAAGERTEYVRELDRMVAVLAYLITRPAFPANVIARLARRLEERDPLVVTKALLGPPPTFGV